VPDELDTIFSQAVAIPDPAARAAHLDGACAGKPALRRRLDQLVDAHFRAEADFLERPAGGATAAYDTVGFVLSPPAGGAPSEQVGPYKLLEVIGEGGMGTVWLADQQEPVRRRVAVKVIKAGMDSRAVLARFEAERQALALMDHPNIAKVLDAGATPDGRPYFAMELVKGVPITRYCDDARLPPAGRLALFADVCGAVQHAHQKGVIHRDLKPSNVLVGLYDGKPVVKVIDFGVAKAAGQPLTDRTLFTGFGAVVGTPEYMSPEQATLDNVDVDTRSDVYSLGVLLYELLTGTTPVTRERVREAALLEVLRVVREEDPPRPSTRISSTDARANIAAVRGSEPARLSRLLRGELDWVALRALEKDRGRRYESAAALADDVRRFLADEPVRAHPPSALYRLRKFARRRRGVVAAVAVVAAALVVGTAVSAWQAVRADAARQLAEAHEREEKQARVEAEGQRKRAEANFHKAVEAVDRMLTRVGEDTLREVPQMEPVRRAVLEDALAFYREFLAERADDARLRQETAVALQRVGNICADLGKADEARVAFDEALRIFLALHAADPDEVRYRVDVCHTYNDLGWRNTTSAADKAEYHRKAAEAIEPVVAARPADFRVNGKLVRSVLANTLRSRGSNLVTLGRLDVAGPPLLKAVDLSRGDDVWTRDVHASSLATYGYLLHRQARLAEAVAACEQAIAARELVVKADPGRFYLWELATDHLTLGQSLAASNRLEAAAAAFRRAAELTDPLAIDFPSMVHFRQTAQEARAYRVGVLRRLGQREEANRVLVAMEPRSAADYVNRAAAYRELGEFDRALADLTEGIRRDPTFTRAYHDRGIFHLERGDDALAVGDFDAAERLTPFPPHFYKRRALAQFRLGRFDLALADVARGVEARPADGSTLTWIAPELVARCPDAAFREGMLRQADRAVELTQGDAEARLARAQLVGAVGDDGKAREEFDAVVAGVRGQLDSARDPRAVRTQLAGVQAVYGRYLLHRRRFAEAEGALRESLSIREQVMPDNWLRFNTQSTLGGALLGQGKYAEAEPLLLAGYEGLKAREATIPAGLPRLAEAVERLVALYDATNRPDKAREWRARLPLPVAPPPRPRP
jgi:serine/threonine protein kinase